MSLGIDTYCSVYKKSVSVNGREIFYIDNKQTAGAFLKQAYKALKIGYPKFYKMDIYSKLAIIAADVLIKGSSGFHDISPAKTGVVLSNASASLDTDRKHQKTISEGKEWFPSPAVFVYTLPNIMNGEICIRHKLTGEQMFFVSEKFDTVMLEVYIRSLFDGGLVDQCLGGWVEADATSDNYRAFLFVVNRGNNISFTAENLELLFNKNKNG